MKRSHNDEDKLFDSISVDEYDDMVFDEPPVADYAQRRRFTPPEPPGQPPGRPPGRPPGGPPGRPPGQPPGRPPGGPPGRPPGPRGRRPPGPPPRFIPRRRRIGFEFFEPSGLRFCQFRFTFIWLISGRSFWAFLTFVGPFSVAGWRWTGFDWVFFEIDIRRIAFFECF